MLHCQQKFHQRTAQDIRRRYSFLVFFYEFLSETDGFLDGLQPCNSKRGRGREMQLNETQREELLFFITYHSQFSMSLSVLECKRAMGMMKLESMGILDGVQDTSQAEARLDLDSELWNIDMCWRRFREWVQRTRKKEDWLCVRKLKEKPLPEITACTEAVVARAVKNLLLLLKDVNIIDSEGIVRDPERLFCCDEKGLSQRSDNVARGVVARHQASKALAASAGATWEHLTLTSFVPLSVRRYPVGVIVPTKTYHSSFSDFFPNSVIYTNPGGSTTAHIFTELFRQCLVVPARQHIPADQPIVCVLDSGGGAWLHLCPRLLQICVRNGVRPFYLPGYTTRALMALDMNIHSTMARLWSDFKAAWKNKSQPLTIFVALMLGRAWFIQSIFLLHKMLNCPCLCFLQTFCLIACEESSSRDLRFCSPG